MLTILGGVAFRIRGDAIVGSTTLGRLIWSCPLGWGFGLTMQDYWIIALAPPLLFLGVIWPWMGTIDHGRNEDSFGRDMIVQTYRGLIFTLPLALFLWFRGIELWWAPMLAGLMCAVVYEAAWQLPDWWIFKRGPVWGELLFGATIGLSLDLTWWHHHSGFAIG